MTATVTDVRAPAVRRRMLPAILRSTAGPSLAAGINPWRSTADEVCAEMAWVPLLRIDPDDGPIAAGPDDPGGTAWVWRQAVVAGMSIAAIVALARVTRARLR